MSKCIFHGEKDKPSNWLTFTWCRRLDGRQWWWSNNPCSGWWGLQSASMSLGSPPNPLGLFLHGPSSPRMPGVGLVIIHSFHSTYSPSPSHHHQQILNLPPQTSINWMPCPGSQPPSGHPRLACHLLLPANLLLFTCHISDGGPSVYVFT